MAIDALALERELTALRELASAKLADDPIPAGKEAERRLQADIERYDLKGEIADLETKGYAVIPPEKAAPMELFDRIRAAILKVADEDEREWRPGLGKTLQHLLPRDPVFEEVLTSPVPLTLVTYMLGWRAKISQVTGLVKDTRTPPLTIHADHSYKFPTPWPLTAQYCNLNWITGDYTRENGAVCVWPGSHRWGRNVPPELQQAHAHPDLEVLEVPKGSVIAWHGSLWHGALPRTSEGQRVTLVMPFVRDHVQTQELYWATVTPEMIERNPARFCTLVGLTSRTPWISQDFPLPATAGAPNGSQWE